MRLIVEFAKKNYVYIGKQASKWVCTLYAILGFVSTFVSMDDLFPDGWNFTERLAVSSGILIVLFIVLFIACAIKNYGDKRYEIISANANHKLYFQFGDLFDAQQVENSSERRNIVIPVNRCFDTLVDNKLVSSTSLHGSVINRLISSGVFTRESLDMHIENELKKVCYDTLTEDQKPDGKRQRYPVGTVVSLPGGNNEHYFLWALSTFDEELTAETSMCDYAIAVQRLIEAIDKKSEGYPVLMPLAGGGLSRTGMQDQEIVEYIINCFKANRRRIHCDIHIVARESLKAELAIKGIES